MADLDIVIPVYNSKLVIADLINRLNNYSDNAGFVFRVIFVDDGSRDGSEEIIISETKKFDYKLVKLAKNYGQHTATAVGLGMTDAPLVATIDDDLQHDPFELTKMIDHLKNTNSDLVFGKYDQKHHSVVRNAGSILLKKIFQLEGLDYSGVTSFRLMKRSVTQSFRQLRNPIIFIEQYLVKIAKNTSICEVKHAKRISGKSSYSNWKLLKFALKIVLFHSSLPLKFTTRFGLLMAVFFFIFGCYYIYDKIFNDVQLGFTSIIVAIFFSTGLLLMSIGIIGEYIRKIWISQNKEDQIVIIE